MLMMDHRRVSTAVDLARVWLHETRRVFADRLISYEDKQWFEDLARVQGAEHLGLDWNEAVGTPGTPRNFIMYADFLIPGADPKVGGIFPPQRCGDSQCFCARHRIAQGCN